MSPTKITNFFVNLSKISFLKVVEWKFWSWLFCKNMKDAFNEGLPYTAHFVVSHSFLRWSHNLLTFIIQLTLINSNLIKKKDSLLFQIKFKQFHTFCVYSKLQCIFTLYVYCSFVLILDIFVCNYCRKLFVIKYFLLTSSNDV